MKAPDASSQDFSCPEIKMRLSFFLVILFNKSKSFGQFDRKNISKIQVVNFYVIASYNSVEIIVILEEIR